MPFKLSTTIGKIQNIPNTKNIEIINEIKINSYVVILWHSKAR